MRRVKIDPSGCSVNFDHIVTVERSAEWVLARLVTGSTAILEDVYPVAFDLFRVGKDTWVNPVHVTVVDVGYNKDAHFRDIMAGTVGDDKNYMQVRLETVLGGDKFIWPELYGLDELEDLANQLDGWGKE